MLKIFAALLLFFLIGCESSAPTPKESTETIPGRQFNLPLYRVKNREQWARKDSSALQDTMVPLCEFTIEERIRVTIHNFPTTSLEMRIPPAAQIERWKKQFQFLDPLHHHTHTESWGGFMGLHFEGTGKIGEQEMKMLGWSLQLAPEHFRILEGTADPYYRQALSDCTIKVLGPKDLVEQYQEQLELFAHSFELIREIPQKI